MSTTWAISSDRRTSAEKVAASLGHCCLAAEAADVDVGQSHAGALTTVAFLAYPRCGGVKVGAWGALVLRFRPPIGGEIVAGEANAAQKACPDGDPGQRGRQSAESSTARCPALEPRLPGFLAAHLHRLLDVRVHQLPHRHGRHAALIELVELGKDPAEHGSQHIGGQPLDPVAE